MFIMVDTYLPKVIIMYVNELAVALKGISITIALKLDIRYKGWA